MKTSIHQTIIKIITEGPITKRVLLSCGHAIWTASRGPDPACYKCWLDHLHPDQTGSLYQPLNKQLPEDFFNEDT